jgi:transglutaminase-like putative cysteine protease
VGKPGRYLSLGALAQLGLALAAALALSLSWREMPARLLPALVAVAFLAPIRRLPSGIAIAMERAAWVLLALTGLYGLAWSLYPLIPEGLARVFPRVSGYGLAVLAALFLSGRSVWAASRGLFPAALGVLVVAAWDTLAPIHVAVALAGVSAFLLLAVDEDGRGGLSRLGRIAVFSAGAALVALGMTRLLPWAQPFVEGAIARVMDPSSAISGFSLGSELGSAPELILSQRVLMHVATTRPQKLRAAVFVHFDGRGWRLASPSPRDLEALPALPAAAPAEWLGLVPGGDFLVTGGADSAPRDGARTRIVQIAPVAGALPAPGHPWLVRRSGTLSLDAFGILGPPGAGPETYAIVSGDVLPAPAQTPLGTPSDGSEERGVPADTDPRLAALAERLAAGSSSPETRLARTVAFVQGECHYSLKPGRFRTQQPVAEFLFEKKRGYCEYFATTAAVLLRLEGIPARYVRGFTVREANRLEDEYVVREADAHAWIEAWLPGRGWIEADPTPAGEYEAAHGSIDRSGIRPFVAWLAARFAELRAYIRAGDLGAAGRRLAAAVLGSLRKAFVDHPLIIAAVLLLPFSVWAARRGLWRRLAMLARRSPASDGPHAELAALMADVDAFWRRHGHSRPASRTPLEHVASLRAVPLPLPQGEAARQAVDLYYRGRFAGVALPAGAIRAARAEMTRTGH